MASLRPLKVVAPPTSNRMPAEDPISTARQVAERKVDTRAIDRLVYDQELAPRLPSTIIDCHVHVGLSEYWGPVSSERYSEIWAMEVAKEQSWEQLRSTYRLLFPKQEVRALAFGWVYREVDVERNNTYVRAGISDPRNNADGLFVTRPGYDTSTIAEAMSQGFLGIKPYPDLAAQPTQAPSIYDFLPRTHLALLNQLGGLVMLHLPRKGRLGDPDNARELLEISEAFPAIKIVIAHIGRAYCLPTAQRGLPPLIERQNLYFDTSANLNTEVFRYALDTIGPDRLLFGSDLPVTLMRGRRDHIGEQYVNWTDGDYSWNLARKSPEEEATYTFYLYEELRALIDAVKRSGLGQETLEKILYANSARLLGIER